MQICTNPRKSSSHLTEQMYSYYILFSVFVSSLEPAINAQKSEKSSEENFLQTITSLINQLRLIGYLEERTRLFPTLRRAPGIKNSRYIFRTHRDKRLISLAALTVGLTNRGERDSSSFCPVEFLLIVTPRRDKIRCNAELKGKLKRENYHLPDPRRGLGEIGNSGGIIPNRVSS